jgi:hypothetical protein
MGACGFEGLAGSRIIPALQELKDVHPAPLRRGVLFGAPDNDLEAQTRAQPGHLFTGDGKQLSPGTAQTLPIGELGGAFSGLGLGLCGLATAALMPLINRLLWQALRGLHFGIGKNARHARRRTSLERRLDDGASSPYRSHIRC